MVALKFGLFLGHPLSKSGGFPWVLRSPSQVTDGWKFESCAGQLRGVFLSTWERDRRWFVSFCWETPQMGGLPSGFQPQKRVPKKNEHISSCLATRPHLSRGLKGESMRNQTLILIEGVPVKRVRFHFWGNCPANNPTGSSVKFRSG